MLRSGRTRSEAVPVGDSSDRRAGIAALLQEAAETHHVVYRITDGEDADWASWYADWLLDHSELPELLGVRPVRSHLIHALVELDRAHPASSGPWQEAYAEGLMDRFVP
jgi:hypothetical protein